MTVPNAFTPNGDHVNHDFNAFGDCVFAVEGHINNRWDQELSKWKGKGDGIQHPIGEAPKGKREALCEVSLKYLQRSILSIRIT